MSDERLPELYLEALELDAADRAELLRRIERESPELAAELARLLATPDSAASPIDGSSLAAAGIAPRAETAPLRVGPFRIVRQLGQGGMARVFLAEQETPDYRRTVALKLIDRPGSDEEDVRRFRDEVRILASLDHPNIVRFLDGGQSAEGVWFLALEYVEGDDLLTHARRRELGIEERVRLVLAVARAVAYAHERGVVHRDIKPSNVLVGRDGRPRLLDFGISKLLDPSQPSVLTTTQAGPRPFTPAYASPEQLAGATATAASDIYSLGVVLFELLAGRRPLTGGFASDAPAAGGAASDGSGSAPETPSSVLRRERGASRPEEGRAAGAAASGAKGRRPRIDRDLDAICLVALQRNPADRYPSAEAFAADLERYLAAQPVVARAGGPGARAGRWLRRHRAQAALAAAFALVAAALVAPFLLRERAPDAAGAAPSAAAPTIFPFDPSNPPPAEESERRLAEAPEDLVAGAALALRLARDGRADEARIVLGRMRQVPGKELDPLLVYAEGRIVNLEGEDQRALVLFTRARDLALAAGRGELLGAIRTSRAAVLSKLGQRDASRAELELARADSERAGDHRTLYRTLNGLALEQLQRGEMATGEASLEAALRAAERAGIEPTVTLENLTAVRALRGRPDLAEPLARQLLEQHRRAGRSNDEGEISKTLALVLRDLGRSAEAAPLFDRARELLRDATNGNLLADVLHAQGMADLEDGRFDRIDALVAELEATGRKNLKRLPLGYAHWLRARRAALGGDLAAARHGFAEARRLLLADGNPDMAASSNVDWATAEALAGDPEAALRVVAEGLAALEQPDATMPGYFGATLRARIDAEAGRGAEARERLAALGDEAERSPSLPRRIAFLAARAALATAESRFEAARADLETALALARTSGRKRTELELRFDLAAVDRDPDSARALAGEAEALGYLALAERARRLAAGSPSVPPARPSTT